MTDRQDISLPCMLESTLENANYGTEYCGAVSFCYFPFLNPQISLSLFCSGPLFYARLSLYQGLPLAHRSVSLKFVLYSTFLRFVNLSTLRSRGGVVTCEILCNIDREWM
jgi:hypothetical protein